MNVLEKILEEIDREIYKQREICNEVLNTPGYRLYERTMKRAKDIVERHIDDDKDENIHSNDDWIPVEERLPEENNGKYYPMLNVSTSYGVVKWGFYRVRDKEWYIYSELYDEFVEAEDKEIIAWQPLPEPYKSKETVAAGMEHIMSRFTKVE